MTRLNQLKKNFRPGRPYRTSEVAQWSKSVGRDLQTLVKQGFLKKLSGGMYYRPKRVVFGEVPVEDRELVRAFLKDDRFLLTSPNAYNSLGVGATQLYNKRVVYNHKRHGDFNLGRRTFSFRMKHHFPLGAATEEFLLVDLMNNLDELAEDQGPLVRNVGERALMMNPTKLGKTAHEYGTVGTKHFFDRVLAGTGDLAYAA